MTSVLTDNFMERIDNLLDEIIEKINRGDKFLRMLNRLNPKHEAWYREKISEWFDDTRKQIVKDLNRKFAKAESPFKITSKLTDWDFIETNGITKIKPLNLDIMKESGDAAFKIAGIEGSFDVLNPISVELAGTITARMVTLVTDETKKGISEAIRQGLLEGESMSQVVKRIKPLIGLSGRGVKALDNYKGFLQGKKPPLKVSQIDKKVGFYRRKLHRKRAELIARTETARAQSEGTIEGYRQGGIKRVEWVTAAGACPQCAPLNGHKFTLADAQSMIPLHPDCLTDAKVRIFTSKGWFPIGKLKEGDLVLTHKGRFRKITHVFKIPKRYPLMTQISFKNYFHSRHSLILTGDHPVLVQGKWKPVSDLKVGEDIPFLSFKKCEYCGKAIPYFSEKFCNFSCRSKFITRKQWNSDGHRKNVSLKNSISMIAQYEDGLRDGKKGLEKAHKKLEEMAKQGIHPFQLPLNRIRLNQSLGRRNYGKTWLEERFGWILKQLEVENESQFPIKYGKDKLGRDRYYFVDFALPKEKIAIECDGSYWHKDKKRDKIREERIKSLGWTVLRFSENEINSDLKKCGLEVLRIQQNHSGKYSFLSCTVKKIKRWEAKKPLTLYNLEVEGDNSFVAKGFVIHNCRCTWISVEEARKPKPETFISIPENKWGTFGKDNIQLSSKLTKDDFVGIDNYIGSNLSFDMNGLLRGNKEAIERLKTSGLTSIFNNFNNKLSVVINKSKLTSNIKAYRGVSDKFPILKIGDEIVDKGFTSLSLDIDHASSFMPKGGRLLEVRVSKGTKAFFDKIAQDNKLWNPQKLKIPEKELVLQKGARLRFIETVTRPDGWKVDIMEIIK